MNGTLSERVTPLMTSAMNSACFSLSMTQGPAMRNRLPEPMLNAVDLEGNGHRKALTAEDAEIAERITQMRPTVVFLGETRVNLVVQVYLRRHLFRPVKHLDFRSLLSRLRASRPFSYAAPTNVLNNGCGSSGFDLNSGWNWHPMKCGWSGNSTIST